jgi:uncharacterized protein involved in oxidation of intracellular sulfur
MSLANTSQHLQVLRAAGLVEATKEGLFVTYRLADPKVSELFLALRGVAEARLAEVERIKREFLAERAQLKAGQTTPNGYYNLERMLKLVLRRGHVLLCGSCMDARGLKETEIVEGAERSTLDELTSSPSRRTRSSCSDSRRPRYQDHVPAPIGQEEALEICARAVTAAVEYVGSSRPGTKADQP